MHGIEQAKADVALRARLEDAPNRLASLTTLQTDIIAHQGLIRERAAQAMQDTMFAKFSTVDISDRFPDESVIRSSFQISYTVSAWNGRESVSKLVTSMGLSCLPDGLLGYLIEKHPHKIPAKIANLAADPYDAFNRYFVGLGRGYLIGTTYDTERKA